ncbi:hypothetical protein [Methylomicrobium album]|uniref:hypothetical protein n=1 Tax=Methylomicrobium album TaxID=39775 RepID=UPI0002D66E29|nr:hypothetical protein [Methylomicrobium album]
MKPWRFADGVADRGAAVDVLEMAWSQINLDRAEWRIPTTKNGEPQTVISP